jgi:hypothetical protein
MLLKQPVDGIEGSVVRLLAMPSLQQIADCIKQHIIGGRGLVHGIPSVLTAVYAFPKDRRQELEGSPIVIFTSFARTLS